ncbi:MAG: hypothetical protein QOE08_139 [Thermoleophilaceae bacterium]|jgi:hypothetical protein|nr:hypothetical protein [Thermoleophilaceae bacterium]
MKRLSIVAVLVAAAIVASLSFGSSHREAPNTSQDPTADDTDVYAFTADDAPGSLTLVANWIPFEDPAGGPNFYNFDPRAHYYLNIDNTGDGQPDVRYEFTFKTRIVNRNSFAYATPTVTSLGDPNLNVRQSYTLVKESLRGGKVRSERTIARNLPVAPSNIGPKTMPNYGTLAAQAVRHVSGGGKVFVGQRDDPFFVDLGTTFDSINFRSGTGNQGGGKDDLAGYNTNSIVLQVPEAQVTSNHKSVSGPAASNAVVGVWSSTERRKLQVTDAHGSSRGSFVQVSRLGNPLVNEVVIPLGSKDQFNRTKPKDDAKLYGAFVVKPELAKLMNALFHLGVKETGRTDIVTALLTGVPGLTQIGKKPAAADTLKINLGVPPKSSGGNRFGVLAGDNAGFPNGRRLSDDVVDIELRVFGGFLLPASQGGKKLPLGDGVDGNDKQFLSSFPYVAPPTAGFDSGPKRTEPAHSPTPGQP